MNHHSPTTHTPSASRQTLPSSTLPEATMLQLSVNLKREIATYLNVTDAYSMAQSCKVMCDDLALTKILLPYLCLLQGTSCYSFSVDIPKCGPRIPSELLFSTCQTHACQIAIEWNNGVYGDSSNPFKFFIIGHPGPKEDNNWTFENGSVLYASPITVLTCTSS